MSDEWFWFASSDEEIYTVGPCATREEAVQEAASSELGYNPGEPGHVPPSVRFHVVEAQQPPVDLSRYFDADAAYERMDEAADEERGDPDGNGSLLERLVTDAQFKDFEVTLRAAVRDWQARHKIVVPSWRFLRTRNGEWVTVDLHEKADDLVHVNQGASEPAGA